MLKSWNSKQKGFGLFSFMLLLFGVTTEQSLFYAMAGGTFSILLISLWWNYVALKEVVLRCAFTKKRTFPGDPSILRVELTNHKSISVPFIRFSFVTPHSVAIKGLDRKEIDSKRLRWSTLISIKARQTLVFEYEVVVDKRGVIGLEEAMLESGDPFGLGKKFRMEHWPCELVVYPPLSLPIPTQTNLDADLGKTLVRRFMFDDPTYHTGARPYMPGDPLKRIDWNVSARTRQLHTKQFTYTSEKHVTIIANVHTAEIQWMNQNNEILERTLSLIATVLLGCSKQGYTYEWLMNVSLPKSRQLLHERGGLNKRDLPIHFEKLGRLKSFVTTPIDVAFTRMKELSNGSGIFIVITSFQTEKMKRDFDMWSQSGGQVWIINPSHDEYRIDSYIRTGRKGEKKDVS